MWKNLQKKLGSSESYISLALGLAVVLMLGSLVYNYMTRKPDMTAEEKKASGAQGQENTKLPAKHVVQKGETLWSISEKYYRSGYNWIDIQKANNLTDANGIEAGQTLDIPSVTPAVASSPVTAVSPTEVVRITGSTGAVSGTSTAETTSGKKTYKVAKGDSLWKIAVRQYNNGYQWSMIARENRLPNPDLIYPDTVLVLP